MCHYTGIRCKIINGDAGRGGINETTDVSDRY
jgi:hypothetical protein